MSDEARHNDRARDESNRPPDPAPPAPAPEEVSEPVCAVCGHPISQDDLVCPNCGANLVAG